MEDQASRSITPPSIAKSASITTLGKSWGAVGTSGKASFELPLPISPGRGFAPVLGLSYDSQAGNGPFGFGWSLSVNAITRQTSKGVPRYLADDVIVGPGGDEWMPELDDQGQITSRAEDHYNGEPVGKHSVVRYWPRVEGAFDLIELWQPGIKLNQPPFWLVHGADGSLHIYGKTEATRRADPQDALRVGAWLLLESMNAQGEHIVFEYKPEDTTPSSGQPHDFSAQRYVSRVLYGNAQASEHLYAWTVETPAILDWHFHLLFDYGERTLDWSEKPVYGEPFPAPGDHYGEWLIRRDPFFTYGYGFELSTRRLCRQVLMFHHFPKELGPAPALVKRLLLEYLPEPVFYSQLQAAHYQAYDASGAVENMPPMEFDYSPFDLNTQSAPFFPFEHMPGIQDEQYHQCVDLYGEGVPGFLCRYHQSWYYREPVRGANGPDDISYGPWRALPSIPVADGSRTVRQSLTDLTGDGRLDWIIAQPSVSGFYTLNPDRSWSPFSVFTSFPLEFFNVLAQFGDLTGSGLQSLALIGPKSVRLYGSLREDGFTPAQDIPHLTDDSLPLFSNSRSELVFLGHMLCSDLPDLCRIRHDEIKCWPNLGHGRFGKGFVMSALPFDYATFDSARVRIADLDGSGAPALIYLNPEHFEIYLNRGGNRLEQEPIRVAWPEGVRYDTLSQISFADLQGLGCASLILTVPHMSPRHWRYDFVGARPYALVASDNNMGCYATVDYRSSTQEWLDEKHQGSTPEKPLACYLPFPVQVVSRQTQLDEITGNCLSQGFNYFQGYYDSHDREFRGFGLLHQTDSETSPDEGETGFTAPLLTRTWFHTGRLVDLPRESYFNGDEQAQPLGDTLLCRYHENDCADQVFEPIDEDTLHEIARSLSGSVLRMEVFGIQKDRAASLPYSVEQSRYLVRELRPMAPHHPHAIVLPLLAEKISYQYERFADDPLCRHDVTLQWDRFGTPIHSFSVSYARRKTDSDNPPFEDADQAQWWRDAHDQAQQSYYLTEARAEFIHLDELQGWRLALPWRQRGNALVLPKGSLPAGLKPVDVSYESFNQFHTSTEWNAQRQLSQLSRQRYLSTVDGSLLPEGRAHFEALAGPLERAELDKTALAAYDNLPPPFDIREELRKIHFQPMVLFLDPDEEEDLKENLWSGLHGFTEYAKLDGFYKVQAFNATVSHGETCVTYDDYHLLTTAVTLPDGCTTRAEYDYHALAPERVIDANDNTQEALYEPSGQPLATSVFGTENGADIGFKPLVEHQRPEDPSPGAAIGNPVIALQKAASVLRKDLRSWMGTLSDAPSLPASHLTQWIAQGYVLPSLHIRASARRRLTRLKARTAAEQALLELIRMTPREPVHSLVLTADDYPDAENGQQIQMQLTCVDGFGRTLQTKQLVEPGLAYVVNENGELELDPSTGQPKESHAVMRWRVSERVEYNNKGLAVRVYRPYFADAWRYINDQSFRQFGYHDQQFYDSLGRPVQVISAKGYVSRETYHPWYQTSEDFNDTYDPVPVPDGNTP